MTKAGNGLPPGNFGAHAPQYVFGRLNLDFQGKSHEKNVDGELMSSSVSDDFSYDHPHSTGIDGYMTMFKGGHGDVFDDDGWNILELDDNNGSTRLLTMDDEQSIINDLSENNEYSSISIMNKNTTPWGKVDSIALSQEFYDVSNSVIAHREKYEEFNNEFKRLNKELDRKIHDEEEYAHAGDIYDNAQKALEHYENYSVMKMYREEYLNHIARSLKGSLDKEVDDMTISDEEMVMDSPTGMYSVGYAESGTREWLEMRQDSLGGSDIGTLTDKGFFSYDEKNKVWESKVAGVSDDDVREQESEEITDARSRGNAMENVIGALYAHHTGKNIAHNKSTWKTSQGAQHINFDFVELDNNGKVHGAVEIKNVNDSRAWGNPSEGLDGVPAKYRAQVLQQAYHSGAQEATVVALMGGTTMKAYREKMTPELKEEARFVAEEIAPQYMDKVRQARETYRNTGSIPPAPHASSSSSRKGIPAMVTKTKKISGDKKRFMHKLAVLGSTTTEDIAEKFVSEMGTHNTKEWTPEKQSAAFQSVYSTLQPKGRFTGIDIETNAISPTQGNIIEFGGVTYDMDKGEEKSRFGKLYSPTPGFLKTKGTGSVDVHNIDLEMVKNSDVVSRDGVSGEEILRYVEDNGGKLVAHNANFEKGWLRAHVKGWAEAESRGDISFVDTMDITRHTLDTPGNSLKEFVTYHGISEQEYNQRAHRAVDDTEMMMESFVSWSKNNG